MPKPKKNPKHRRKLREQIVPVLSNWIKSNDITAAHVHELLCEKWEKEGRPPMTRQSFYFLFQGKIDKNLDNWNVISLPVLIDMYELSLDMTNQLDIMSIFTGYDSPNYQRQINDLRETLLRINGENKKLKERIALANHHLDKARPSQAKAALMGRVERIGG